jgi:hypothetical protein
MKRLISGLAIAGSLALGLTVPSSAAPSTDSPPNPVEAERQSNDEKLRELESGATGFGSSTPRRTEGIAGGFVFVPVTPFRSIDSRDLDNGFMTGGRGVYFSALRAQDNTPMLPAEAVAVTYNLTVDQTVGVGFCSLFPASASWPGTSSINWTGTGQTIANGGTVAIDFLDDFGQVAVYCGPAANLGTYFIVDITGYYI